MNQGEQQDQAADEAEELVIEPDHVMAREHYERRTAEARAKNK